MKYIFLLFICITFCTYHVKAQGNDTVPPIVAYYTNEFFHQRDTILIDTVLTFFHTNNFNLPLRSYTTNLGYEGSPNRSLLYEPLMLNDPFYIVPFANSLYSAEKLPAFSASTPYTELFYTIGQFHQQQAKILHTQNVNNHLNVGIKAWYYKHEGEYENQATKGQSIAPWVEYNSEKFSSYFRYAYNNREYAVNGGLLHDSLLNKEYAIMALQNASSKLKNHQAASVLKWNLKSYSISADTSQTTLHYYPISLGYSYKYNSYMFSNHHKPLQTAWYPAVLHDSLSTADTALYSQHTNKIFIDLYKKYKNIAYTSSVALGHQYIQSDYKDYRYSHQFNKEESLFSQFNAIFKIPKLHFQTMFDAHYALFGANQHDMNASVALQKQIRNYYNLQLSHKIVSATPNNVYHIFSSNHIAWDTTLQRSIVHRTNLQLTIPQYYTVASLTHYNVQAPIYFNSKGIIQQQKKSSQIVQGNIEKTTMLRNFIIHNSIILQSASRYGVQHPRWATYNSVAYSFLLFKKLALFHFGAEALIYQKHFVPDYSPCIATFVPQTDNEYGNFPILNGFLSIKYKPIRFSISYNGLYSTIVGKNFLQNHYPQQGGYLSASISWIFFN